MIKTIKLNHQQVLSFNNDLAPGSQYSLTGRAGKNVILVTANFGDPGVNSTDSLNVHYFERLSSCGLIPGGFIKREGRQSDREILISRTIDRSIRSNLIINSELQIIIHVLSYDQDEPNIDIMAAQTTFELLNTIGVTKRQLGIVRICYDLDNQTIINPTTKLIVDQSPMNLVLVGNDSHVAMMELGSHNLTEAKLLKAIKDGLEYFKEVNLLNEVKRTNEVKITSTDYLSETKTLNIDHISDQEALNMYLSTKDYDKKVLTYLNSLGDLTQEDYEVLIKNSQIKLFNKAKNAFINGLLNGELRYDGRNNNELRHIEASVNNLPSTHGSALFQRGNTQVLATVTLGNIKNRQLIESLDGLSFENVMVHYYFHSFCSGSVGKLSGPKRREIGHAHLTYKSIKPLISEEQTIKINSEVLSADGSTSMASICASSLALWNAGIIDSNELLSGVAMGLVIKDGKFSILTDITQHEDMFGMLDLKMGCSAKGINVIQMDVKSEIVQLPLIILEKIITKGFIACEKIRSIMIKNIEGATTSAFIPVKKTMQVDPNQIKFIIGKKGVNINRIKDETKCSIQIEDSGLIEVMGTAEAVDKTLIMIKESFREDWVRSDNNGTYKGNRTNRDGAKDKYRPNLRKNDNGSKKPFVKNNNQDQ